MTIETKLERSRASVARAAEALAAVCRDRRATPDAVAAADARVADAFARYGGLILLIRSPGYRATKARAKS